MPGWTVKLDGRADPELVRWLDPLVSHLRVVPAGWVVEVTLKRTEPPDDLEN